MCKGYLAKINGLLPGHVWKSMFVAEPKVRGFLSFSLPFIRLGQLNLINVYRIIITTANGTSIEGVVPRPRSPPPGGPGLETRRAPGGSRKSFSFFSLMKNNIFGKKTTPYLHVSAISGGPGDTPGSSKLALLRGGKKTKDGAWNPLT